MWALNEIAGLVQKAARGAGFPVGQAEDLGRVAVYLASTGASVAPITAALREPPDKIHVSWADAAVHIHSGPAALIGPVIGDAFGLGYTTAVLADVAHGPLVGAFLAESGVATYWKEATVTRSDTTVLQPTCEPVTVPQDDWQFWLTLAAKTYVPETETSRLGGAGAGLTDND